MSVEASDADAIVQAYHPPAYLNPDADLALEDGVCDPVT